MLVIKIGETKQKYADMNEAIKNGCVANIPFDIKNVVYNTQSNEKVKANFMAFPLATYIKIENEMHAIFIRRNFESLSLQKHLKLKNLIQKFKDQHKNVVPNLETQLIQLENEPCEMASYNYAIETDAILGFLNWVEYWIDYAINNCENPAINMYFNE